MAWLAFDRAIKTAEQFGFEAPVGRWRKVRARIHRQACKAGYNTKLRAFVQTYDATDLDASALLIPLVGFLPPSDPRVRSTLEAIERHLMADGLVFRYDTRRSHDRLRSREGAFLACSFWFADNLIFLGRRDEAKPLFTVTACLLCAMTLDCSLKNTIPSASEWSETFRRHSPTSRSSIRHTIS